MSLLTSMLAAANRLLTFYNGDEYRPSDNPGGMTGPDGMATNWDPCIQDIGTVATGMGDVYTDLSAKTVAAGNSAAAAAGSAAAAETTRAATQTLLTQGQSAVQGLLGQAQTARDGAAADRVLAQSYVGTATNVIVPAINYRLASAWDANGNATAYNLTNVVATGLYDTSKDPDGGRWCKGRLARMTSWYNETLNTATRGAKRRFPALAPWVLTTTSLIIYDQNDLDASGSPRMWKVFSNASVSWATAAVLCGTNSSASAKSGRFVVGDSSGNFGAAEIDFVRDRAFRRTSTAGFGGDYRGTLADANSGKGYAQNLLASQAIVSATVNGVDMRVLPGTALDPVSRLPIPTIAVATPSGASVIHPTGLIVTCATDTLARKVQFLSNNRLAIYRSLQQDSTGQVHVGPIPFVTANTATWQQYSYSPSAGNSALGSASGVGAPTEAIASSADGLLAIAKQAGLEIRAEDTANPRNGMVAYATKDYATGWLPSETRLAAICEGAGSNGASGGELVSNGTFDASTTGWTSNGATPSVVSGEAVLTQTSTTAWSELRQAVTVTPGVPYTVSGTLRCGTAPACDISLWEGSTNIGNAGTAATTSTYKALTVVPTTATLTILLRSQSMTAGQTSYFDNISCRKAGAFSDAVTGTGELIGSGDGTSTAGWSAGNASIAAMSGELEVTAAASGTAYGRYLFNTVIGETYCLRLDARKAAGSPDFSINIYPSDYSASLGATNATTTTSTAIAPIFFKATTATTYVQANVTATATGQKFYLDNVSCKLCIPDRSYKGKGLIVNGTLMRTPAAVGSDLYLISGFDAVNFLERPLDTDLTVAGEFMLPLIVTHTGLALYRVLASTYDGSNQHYEVGLGPDNTVTLSMGDASGTDTLTSSAAIPASKPSTVWAGRRGTRLEIWIDSVLVAAKSTTRTGAITPTAPLRIGRRGASVTAYPATGCSIGLVRLAGYAATPTQIIRAMTDEAAAIVGKMMLGGTSSSVQSLAVDEDTGVLAVGTGDGVSQFAGLRRVARLAPAAGTAFTAASVTSVSAGGGTVLIGTASEAGIVTDLQPIKDELRQPAQVANSNDPILTGVTTDATPLDLGKIFVGEGESVQIEADIMATEYGQTPTEGASYTVRARVRRNLGGNVQLVGSAYHVTVDETTATMDATITVDTTAQAFAINVTGKASTRLVWRAVVRLNWISETRNAAA